MGVLCLLENGGCIARDPELSDANRSNDAHAIESGGRTSDSGLRVSHDQSGTFKTQRPNSEMEESESRYSWFEIISPMNSPLSPGTRLGRYEIHSQIGAGGMGEVYLAQDTRSSWIPILGTPCHIGYLQSSTNRCRYDEAIANFKKAQSHGGRALSISVEIAGVYARSSILT